MKRFLGVPGIAIAGRAGAGKSWLAKELKRELEMRGVRGAVVSLAAPLKEILWDREKLTKDDPGGRERLRQIGDELRAEDPGAVVGLAFAAVYKVWNDGAVAIIDDVRTPREHEAFRDAGFVSVLMLGGQDGCGYRRELDEAEFDHVLWPESGNDGGSPPCARCAARLIVRSLLDGGAGSLAVVA